MASDSDSESVSSSSFSTPPPSSLLTPSSTPLMSVKRKRVRHGIIEMTPDNILKLKELFQLINSKHTTVCKASEYDRGRLNKTIAFYQQCQQRFLDYHKINYATIKNRMVDFTTGLIKLLRESILIHDWDNALKLVNALIVDVTEKAPEILWKAGLMTLIMANRLNYIERFVRHLCVSQHLTVAEVLQDYQIHLIATGNLGRAESLAQDYKQNYTFITMEKQDDLIKNAKVLFQAYQGLTHYLIWKKKVVQEEIVDSGREELYSNSDIQSRLMEDTAFSTMKKSADMAVECMSCIEGKPGVWDIFVVKMLEIYKYYGEYQRARALLESYRQNNPNNPNAHRYLHQFDIEQEQWSNNRVQTMTCMVELDPSSPYVIELYQELEFVAPQKAVSILFDYLDFDHCKDDIRVWKMLNTHIRRIDRQSSGEGSDKDTVKQCWKCRQDWWPFSTLLTDNDSDEVSRVKLKVKKHLNKYFV